MKTLSRLLTVSLFAAIALLAKMTYTYTGDPFNLANGNPGLPAGAGISATLTLSSPLGDNLSNAAPTGIVSWSITDGTNTMNPGNSAHNNLFFNTDGSGNITQWFFDAFTAGTFYMGTFNPESFSDGGNYALADESLNYSINAPSGFAMAYNATFGSWTSSASTPEPATGLLLVAPLAWFAWRRRTA
jgi:hypothetical protein